MHFFAINYVGRPARAQVTGASGAGYGVQSRLISELGQFNGGADFDLADDLAKARILRLGIPLGKAALQRFQALDGKAAGKEAVADRFEPLEQFLPSLRRSTVATPRLIGVDALQGNQRLDGANGR